MTKARITIGLMVFYLFCIFVGFRLGVIQERKKAVKKIEIPGPKSYYLVEEEANGRVTWSRALAGDATIDMLNNPKLKPILKRRKLEIYDQDGNRLY